MAYSLPDFNLLCNRWASPHTPAADPPDDVGLSCQVYFSSRSYLDIQPGQPDLWVPPIFLRLSVAEGLGSAVGDIYGVDPGRADYYKVRWVQKTHAGFPNEYVSILVEQCDDVGTTPRP